MQATEAVVTGYTETVFEPLAGIQAMGILGAYPICFREHDFYFIKC